MFKTVCLGIFSVIVASAQGVVNASYIEDDAAPITQLQTPVNLTTTPAGTLLVEVGSEEDDRAATVVPSNRLLRLIENINCEKVIECCELTAATIGFLIAFGFYSVPAILAIISNLSEDFKISSCLTNIVFLATWIRLFKDRTNTNRYTLATNIANTGLMAAASACSYMYAQENDERYRYANIGLTWAAAPIGLIGACFKGALDRRSGRSAPGNR